MTNIIITIVLVALVYWYVTREAKNTGRLENVEDVLDTVKKAKEIEDEAANTSHATKLDQLLEHWVKR